MYTYYDLLDDVSVFSKRGIVTGCIGASNLGRMIPFAHLGDIYSDVQIFITAGIHAREHISTKLVINQINYIFDNHKITRGGIYFMPMLNPDGNLLCYEGVNSVQKYLKKHLIDINGGSEDFSLFKANARGVDLNTNFDALWGSGKSNITYASSENYIGEYPFSECETKAIKNFTLRVCPKATISYHAKGQELYWQFTQKKGGAQYNRDKQIALKLNSVLNYAMPQFNFDSAGGYKDYCIDTLKIPSFTIELINDKYSHPLNDYSVLDCDFAVNKDIPIILLNEFL